jgi:hypothetical protein
MSPRQLGPTHNVTLLFVACFNCHPPQLGQAQNVTLVALCACFVTLIFMKNTSLFAR